MPNPATLPPGSAPTPSKPGTIGSLPVNWLLA